jgi:glycosyltransferase involved in cell wall biosynthesis
VAKPRVLFIAPALRRAGAESQLVSLVNRLPNDRLDKVLLSYSPGDDLRDEVDAANVKVYELSRKGKLDFSIGKRIGQVIDDNDIDVVHCSLMNALLYGVMGMHFARRKPRLVCVVHTTKNVDLKHDLADYAIHRHLLKRCNQVWFVSSTQAELWMRKMPFLRGKEHIIHNGVDTTHFNPARCQDDGVDLRSKLGIGPEEKVLCSVAAFRPEKLHSVLIDSVGLLRADGQRLRLLLAGVGPTLESVRASVAKLGLQDSVLFLGTLPDVRGLLAASDCKLLVSAAETFSMAMLEAMAMGVPVITTSVGGAGEAIEDGVSGILVRPHDAREIARKIKELLAGDEGRETMGRLARQAVVDRFSVKNMIEKSTNSLVAVAAAN